MSDDPWERVYTIDAYHDGPVLGVADYRGKPHVYERQFNTDEDDFAEHFRLSEIDAALLQLILEKWDNRLRWSAAFQQRETGIDTHPALPQDRQRYEEPVQLIGNRFKASSEHGLVR